MKRRTLLTGLAALPALAVAGALPVMAMPTYDGWNTPERLAAIAEIEAAIEAPGRGLIWVQGLPRSGKTTLIERLAYKYGSVIHETGSNINQPWKINQKRVFLDYDSYESYTESDGCLIRLSEARTTAYNEGKVVVFSIDSPHHGSREYQVIHLPMPDIPVVRRDIANAIQAGKMSINDGRAMLGPSI